MKKFHELLKPYLSIIFGALLFLMFFNYLSTGGSTLAIGIIAVVLATYFLVIGIIGVCLGARLEKGTKGSLEVIGVSLSALFFGVVFLLGLIAAKRAEILGPTGWIVGILSIAASFLIGILLLVAYFVKNKEINKIAYLFGAIFVLALLLEVLLPFGMPVALGEIIILQVVLYVTLVSLLFGALGQLRGDEPVSEQAEENHEEEKPAE